MPRRPDVKDLKYIFTKPMLDVLRLAAEVSAKNDESHESAAEILNQIVKILNGKDVSVAILALSCILHAALEEAGLVAPLQKLDRVDEMEDTLNRLFNSSTIN